MSTDANRCTAKAQVVPDVWKRCIRSVGHAEDHAWIEALNRADGNPMLAMWLDEVDPEPYTYDIAVDGDPPPAPSARPIRPIAEGGE